MKNAQINEKQCNTSNVVFVRFPIYKLKFKIVKVSESCFEIECNKEEKLATATSLREAFDKIGIYVWQEESNSGLLN